MFSTPYKPIKFDIPKQSNMWTTVKTTHEVQVPSKPMSPEDVHQAIKNSLNTIINQQLVNPDNIKDTGAIVIQIANKYPSKILNQVIEDYRKDKWTINLLSRENTVSEYIFQH
jgi:hypothetical protein